MKYLSQLVTSASGSVNGLTASHNRGGQYFRGRVIPTNPQTVQQIAVRNAFGQLAAAWVTTLTETQREAWAAYSELVPLPDALGQSRPIGALPMYQRCNTPRLQAGLAVVNDAPVIYSQADIGQILIDSATPASEEVDIAFEGADGWDEEDGAALLVYLGRAQNRSVNFFKGPYRLAGAVLGDSNTPPANPATVSSPFPFSAGQKIFGQARVTRADGRLSSAQRFQFLAT